MNAGSGMEDEVKRVQTLLIDKSDLVRDLRNDGNCESNRLSEAVTELKDLKKQLDALIRESGMGISEADRSSFDRAKTWSLMQRRFFVVNSFEIYGGVKGLYDYGPPGCAVKNNVVQMWRNHFVVQEAMLEFEGTCLTYEPVLKASGHVDRFVDLMVKDSETETCFRADHIVEEHLEKIIDENNSEDEVERAKELLVGVDGMSAETIDKVIREFDIKAPETDNSLTPAQPFNLMFGTSIGPTGLIKGYLRPETAQGIFVNFKRLLEYAGAKLPFACAQIGPSFRNEIAPRSGLLRVREFMQAEIEHFVHPEQKQHAKFGAVKDVKIRLFPRREQLTLSGEVEVTAGDAVSKGIVDNETLAFYIARTQLFAESIGLKREHIRFRQHLETEMAHYARECWDLEVNSSYGWQECAGLADRSCFDLQNHSEHSKIELNAREVYSEIKSVEYLMAAPVKGVMGKAFKRDAQLVMKAMEGWSEDETKSRLAEFEGGAASTKVVLEDGRSFDVKKEMVTFEKGVKKVSGRNYYPSVIEPSFGIGRLLYCLFEHTFYVREGDDEARVVLRLPAFVAPIKAAVLPLSKNEVFNPMLTNVSEALGSMGIIYRMDDSSATIGKRYSRFDELGTPFGVTVDFDSVKDSTVTLRERDSMRQVRGPYTDVVRTIQSLCSGATTWEEVEAQFPSFTTAE
mmetsp:Transcript_11374/g.34802  ORF Transcript_11374/g.34802 Transcript_11374/m.34802 type:complete len:684 (+) Transcript_11374:120-2171(+)|eukprot:CAMPEP_0198736500 /NCGR_PEP_ID=MMETSP1475-20131203/66086_1 /TAXON_ID= ORGANISM="Unidentified sp., Strain CCMP1999" /NCGR_SAMPLE_ID=MMETSP1475 /ASSEMBLY_ACC=CAM_ASM_001111 /LENGTH=683 /DNA_ID=CAMNT_0044500317 /DNA_START=107 /DNA_END=2158 /DNA_ORIENTATION=+